MGSHTAVKDLLAAGATFKSDRSSDLIRKAIHSRSKLCVELLLKHSANPLALDSRGATLIHTAAAGCDTLEILKPLLQAGIELDSPNIHKCTPLSFTPLNDNHKVARLLLSKGANINNVDKDGDTPLTEAVRLNAHNCLRLFVELGASLETINKRGWTVLHFPGAYGDAVTMEVLSTACLSAEMVLLVDNDGNTPRILFERRRLASSEVTRGFESLILSLRS
ncbi:B-cell lymphoma 3-encoded protein [Colletotrichum sojae]|uniref:B-cell lymphoma 3-encoded protein n=1 Tax=Colletotrichum sojae TaxID=2175907 RepID=A0A8H6J358_9PEZI|nr:B-cell lymphoma 3-encoded protein [Colletotrichum sojae]